MDLLLLNNYITKDLFNRRRNKLVRALEIHMHAAMEWLCSAQNSQNDGGVSIRYSFLRGWMPSYPETTGYIIPTFLNYGFVTRETEYTHRALKMADWLLSIQKKDGSFNGGPLGSNHDSFVFDTGQIVTGLLAAYTYSDKSKYIDGARKAGNWLVSVQDSGGMWKRYTYHDIPHVYYAMVAWALSELGKCVNDPAYITAACKNVDWALTKQRANGWFDDSGFTEKMHSAPYTHNIAYTIQGILETGICLGRTDYIDAVTSSADSLCDVISDRDFCYGTYDGNWHSDTKYSCLTGDAQIALILLRLYEIFKKQKYLETARFLNRFLCEIQVIDGPSPVRGAIGGSYPIWGRYERFSFPNWATKFFVDSLLMQNKIIYT